MARAKSKPLGDLHETIEEVRAELADESTSPAGAVEDVRSAAAPAQDPVPAVARYTSDGILLSPEDFNVGSDGVLVPKNQ